MQTIQKRIILLVAILLWLGISVFAGVIIIMSIPKIRRMVFLYYAVSFGVFANVKDYSNIQTSKVNINCSASAMLLQCLCSTSAESLQKSISVRTICAARAHCMRRRCAPHAHEHLFTPSLTLTNYHTLNII